MKRLLAVLVCVSACSLTAFGHGNLDHILGTVAKINGNILSIEKDGKTTDVLLVALTKYEEAGHAGIRSNLHVGDRVVVHAMKMGGKEEAHVVRFVHPPSTDSVARVSQFHN